jgi:hypothetical protein
LAAAVFVYLLFLAYNTYVGYINREEVFVGANISFEYQENSGANFFIDGDNIFFSTKDGIQYINGKGEAIWKEVFILSYPIMVGDGNCVLVTEERGNTMYVYNPGGKLYEAALPGPIISASLNSNGYASAIVEDGSGYRIMVYDNTGKNVRVVESYTYNVFPISTDISNDNKILAISYYDISSLEPGSRISYFNMGRFDAQPQPANDNTANSGRVEKNQMIPIIKFMNGNTLAAISDKAFILFKIGEGLVSTEISRVPLKNEISQAYFADGGNITLATGKPILNEDSEQEGIVRAYNLNGGVVFETSTGADVTYLSAGFNSVIIGNGYVFTAYTNEGKLLWQHHALQPVNQLLFYKDTKTILEAGSIGANVLKLSKVGPEGSTQEGIATSPAPSASPSGQTDSPPAETTEATAGPSAEQP